VDIYKCEVLCIGGGGGGVTAAITAAKCGADVILVSKEPLGYGDTRISMGLMSCPGIVKEDGVNVFLQDLLKSGEEINDKKLARIMAEKASDAVGVMENFGHLFNRDKKGIISSEVTYFSGGHSQPRTIECPPGGGIAIGNSLRAAAARSDIRVYEEVAVTKLLCNNGRVAGAVCYNIITGEISLICAKTTIIATGGAGWLYYPHTDCAAGVTGDGYALAYEVEAELIDMEQVQFIPFGLTYPPSMVGIYVGEPSLAAPAGVLRNNKGEVILEDVCKMNRAEVSKAMALEIKRGGGTENGGLLLDLTPNLSLEEGKRLWKARKNRGQLDIVRFAYGNKAFNWEEPWDVLPTAHYFMGGIKVDVFGRSNIPGLYATGQAMGGIHGANRLGSVSLAELFVFGVIAGDAAAKESKDVELPDLIPGSKEAVAELAQLRGQKGHHTPIQLHRRLQKVMWEKVGIAREEKEMRQALTDIEEIKIASESINIPTQTSYNQEVLHAIELRHMIVSAKLVTEAAVIRQETRGAHLRLDFPEKDDINWKKNIVLFKEKGELKIRVEAVNG